MAAQEYCALPYDTYYRSYSEPTENKDIINALLNYREKHSNVQKDLHYLQWPTEKIYDSTIGYKFCSREKSLNNPNGVKLLEYDVHGDLNRELFAIRKPNKIIGAVCWLNSDMKDFLIFEHRTEYFHEYNIYVLMKKDDYFQLRFKGDLSKLDSFPNINKDSKLRIRYDGVYENKTYTIETKLHEPTWPNLDLS